MKQKTILLYPQESLNRIMKNPWIPQNPGVLTILRKCQWSTI